MTAALLALAERAARLAGAELLARHGTVQGLAAKSSATDPVTDADRAAEAVLVSTLLGARPDDGILGEEGARQEGTSGLRWVVDPLDGTVNYLYGLPAWSVSVAVEDAEGALVGVVHHPPTDETFAAVRGGGAWLAGVRLHVNEPLTLSQALVATGFSYDPGQRARQARVVAALLPQARDIRRTGSAALDLCALAAGRVDAFYEDDLSPWDVAAGALIAREAGAVVTPLPGAVGIGVVAAHSGIQALLCQLVAGGSG